MKYTKEDVETFKNDPMINSLAKLFGVDLNEFVGLEKNPINAEIKEAERFQNNIHRHLNDMVKDGTLTCEEKTENGVTRRYYYPADNKSKEVKNEQSNKSKKEYEKPEVKKLPFLMTASQLEKFVKAYTELIEAEKKLSYLYGIELHDGESGFGFTSKVNEIIWNFVRIIFGDENADDIADYIFGNSNFDNVKSLYDELT